MATSVYIGPPIKMPLTSMMLYSFIAYETTGDSFNIIKNRYDGATGIHAHAIVVRYAELIVQNTS